ncbi:hypothetical protein DPMN_176250 [Dreissena polymorpha]|uniref:Uncharacterized protein n=1 Tax=Dreissena polymorpha TaxID=45954 RepID=A0A9D4EAX1_DREPO|nr:hypothetical protein DPMN_176250 [Dreissena polymorpha]
MGILSNPKSRQLIVEKVSRYNNILSGACYVVGVIWFMALAYKPFNAKTYFSENALLPGVVESGFFFDFDVSSYITEVKDELKRDKRNVPRDWLYQKMREAGLETYKQNYTIHYPLHILQGQVQTKLYYPLPLTHSPRTGTNRTILSITPYTFSKNRYKQNYTIHYPLHILQGQVQTELYYPLPLAHSPRTGTIRTILSITPCTFSKDSSSQDRTCMGYYVPGEHRGLRRWCCQCRCAPSLQNCHRHMEDSLSCWAWCDISSVSHIGARTSYSWQLTERS